MDIADLSALLGEDVTTASYADIWVVLPEASAAPLLGEARRLADELGCYVQAVVADEALAQAAVAFGADRAHVTLDSHALLAGQQPEFVFFPVSHARQAAQLAQRLRAGLITDARRLSVDPANRALLASHPVYGGDYFVDLTITSPAKVVTVDTRALPAGYEDPDRQGEVIVSDAAAPEASTRDLGPIDYAPFAHRPLTKARVIVSAGSAVRDAEGFDLVVKLAEALGAEVAGDRSARDFDWVDEAHMVGVTAQEVAPDVYIAVGIRGDTIHNAAIAGARCVIAIHPNPDAPIFAAADYGVVTDPKDFVPRLLAQLA